MVEFGRRLSTMTSGQELMIAGKSCTTYTGEPVFVAPSNSKYRGSRLRWDIVTANPAATGPVNAFSLWKPEALTVTRGAESIGTYNKTPVSFRKWCKQCGGHLFSDHPTLGLVDIYAAMIPRMPFEPAVHVNYQETVLHIRDGKPKMKDFPKEMGGSGITLPE